MAPSLTPIVVDNASSDGTLDRVRSRKIQNPQNRGFAAAVNQGVRATDADFILLLNPDVNLLTPVDDLIDAARRHGLAAGKLVDLQGRPQSGFTIRRFPTPAVLIFELFGLNRLWPSNPVNRKYRYFDRSIDEPGPVEQPAGAFLMFRRDVWEKIGSFDEKFHPIWFEDVDFCRRAAAAGFRAEYVPNVQVSHRGAHSIGQLPPGCRARYWCASLLRYAAKHFDALGYRAVCAAVMVSSFPRMVAGMIQQRSLAPILVYSKIVRFAGLCLVSPRGRGVVPTNS
jgi:N-acetylglucosaminyl-diphospho-decaprenol L-rhamnosyltransferase